MTAWDPPWPIFKKLQELFVNLRLYSLYQDEMWFTDKYALGFGEHSEEEKRIFYAEGCYEFNPNLPSTGKKKSKATICI
jgi:hypothetical protein